jgi:hypothetical protein
MEASHRRQLNRASVGPDFLQPEQEEAAAGGDEGDDAGGDENEANREGRTNGATRAFLCRLPTGLSGALILALVWTSVLRFIALLAEPTPET